MRRRALARLEITRAILSKNWISQRKKAQKNGLRFVFILLGVKSDHVKALMKGKVDFCMVGNDDSGPEDTQNDLDLECVQVFMFTFSAHKRLQEPTTGTSEGVV